MFSNPQPVLGLVRQVGIVGVEGDAVEGGIAVEVVIVIDRADVILSGYKYGVPRYPRYDITTGDILDLGCSVIAVGHKKVP